MVSAGVYDRLSTTSLAIDNPGQQQVTHDTKMTVGHSKGAEHEPLEPGAKQYVRRCADMRAWGWSGAESLCKKTHKTMEIDGTNRVTYGSNANLPEMRCCVWPGRR